MKTATESSGNGEHRSRTAGPVAAGPSHHLSSTNTNPSLPTRVPFLHVPDHATALPQSDGPLLVTHQSSITQISLADVAVVTAAAEGLLSLSEMANATCTAEASPASAPEGSALNGSLSAKETAPPPAKKEKVFHGWNQGLTAEQLKGISWGDESQSDLVIWFPYR